MKRSQNRKSPRLQGYDYAQNGAYFVTICTHQREHLFGTIENDMMALNELGDIAHERWQEIPAHFPNIELDAFVVMPNHVHGIVVIIRPDEPPAPVRTRHASSLPESPPPSKRPNGVKRGSLSAIVGSYKSAVTKQINALMGLTAPLVWQSCYHDHIIRNETSLHKIRQYVLHNPALWEKDTFYSEGY